ncbi:MAG: GntR family transcriptional regulator [Alphaproteobacteria bacterium]|nr:GntR family transcriptional regulator [Alphaproteobacteria bacterium]MBU1281617.1 GntR family transcriptional regulator [Alphaproteobacteria bacterium]MBU1574936.1 GntR family transcriptional regulator [Alphaproteobacteria bacterium]MBU1827518.1 GntR family transcriptional regulator [Alphaproteobacteria bacterium]MBU2077293.1 GntR family transcriptional regulator [Alphaproteobacteria bacterium]
MKAIMEKNIHRGTPLEQLLDAIEDGKLTPGTRLRETELAEQLGISRTPVREALHRLHAMGLAEHGPQRGLIVSHLDYDHLRQLFAVREGLEGMAARLAAEYATPAEISLLRELVSLDVGVDNPDTLKTHNKQFHLQIVRASHNAYMIDALENLRIHLSLLPGSTYSIAKRRIQAQDEHQAIIDAVAAHDGDAAEYAARVHIKSGYRARLELLSSQQG